MQPNEIYHIVLYRNDVAPLVNRPRYISHFSSSMDMTAYGQQTDFKILAIRAALAEESPINTMIAAKLNHDELANLWKGNYCADEKSG